MKKILYIALTLTFAPLHINGSIKTSYGMEKHEEKNTYTLEQIKAFFQVIYNIVPNTVSNNPYDEKQKCIQQVSIDDKKYNLNHSTQVGFNTQITNIIQDANSKINITEYKPQNNKDTSKTNSINVVTIINATLAHLKKLSTNNEAAKTLLNDLNSTLGIKSNEPSIEETLTNLTTALGVKNDEPVLESIPEDEEENERNSTEGQGELTLPNNAIGDAIRMFDSKNENKYKKGFEILLSRIPYIVPTDDSEEYWKQNAKDVAILKEYLERNNDELWRELVKVTNKIDNIDKEDKELLRKIVYSMNEKEMKELESKSSAADQAYYIWQKYIEWIFSDEKELNYTPGAEETETTFEKTPAFMNELNRYINNAKNLSMLTESIVSK